MAEPVGEAVEVVADEGPIVAVGFCCSVVGATVGEVAAETTCAWAAAVGPVTYAPSPSPQPTTASEIAHTRRSAPLDGDMPTL